MKIICCFFVLVTICSYSICPVHAEICETTGEGYGSPSKEAIQKIADLTFSPRPDDEAILKQTVQKYLADGLIFALKTGVRVEVGPRWDKNQPIWIRPIGSTKEYFVMINGIKNCRPE